VTEEIINLREAQDQDVPFVTNSWLKSYRHGGSMTKHVPNDVYYAQHHAVLERILPRGVVVVACDSGDPDHILGWMHSELLDEAFVLHYVYVKNSVRGHRIMRSMMERVLSSEDDRPRFHTHSTDAWRKLDMHKMGWVYNPYLLFGEVKRGK